MALFTFHIIYLDKIYIEQINSSNAHVARTIWAKELDFQKYNVKNIHEYDEFIKDLKEDSLSNINTIQNAWLTCPLLGEKMIYTNLVKTHHEMNINKKSDVLFTVFFNIYEGTGIYQIFGARSIKEVISLWLEKYGSETLQKHYKKNVNKRMEQEFRNTLMKTTPLKQRGLVNVWSVKAPFKKSTIELYIIPTDKNNKWS